GIRAEACEGLRNLRTRSRDAGIDQQLAVLSSKHRDIAAGALEYTHVAAQPVDLDLRRGRIGSDQVDDRAGFGKDLTRRKPGSRAGDRRRAETAKAKVTTRERMLSREGHGVPHGARLQINDDAGARPRAADEHAAGIGFVSDVLRASIEPAIF